MLYQNYFLTDINLKIDTFSVFKIPFLTKFDSIFRNINKIPVKLTSVLPRNQKIDFNRKMRTRTIIE